MELSLFNCLPHAPPSERLESCDNNSFILVNSEPVVDRVKISVKENKLTASTSYEIIKPKPVKNENLFPCPPKNFCDNLILKKPETKMRVEAEDAILDSTPVAEEVISHVNGGISIENAPYIPPPDTSSTSAISTSISKVSLPPMEACIEDSNASSIDSPKKKKRYLFNFRPSLGKILVKTKGGDSFKCYTCGGIYRQKFSLKRHFLRTHIDYRYISEADIANCKIPIPSYIEQHSNAENTSNGRKKFKKSSDDVFLENNDSGLLPGLYRCHDCTNVSFDTDAELREHYNKHPDSIKKKYECTICQASFIKKQILSRHLAGHEGKKIKLLCKKCNVEFSSKEALDKHLSTHTSGKTCRICEKVLSNVANRKRHERLHLNSGKRCPHCDQCFAQRKELLSHIKSQHAELCRICNLCNQPFSSDESLALHMKEKHRSSPKLPENANPAEEEPKPKPNPVCYICKRVFPTVYAMLKHRKNAHPFHTKRKKHRKTAKAKIVISNKESGNNEYKKTYIRPGPGRPRGSGKKVAVGEMRFMEKRERVFIRRTRKEDIEFYTKVHENIAYNLTNCIEGRASQLSLKEYNFSEMQQLSDDFEDRVNFPWQFYNFPSWYDVNNVLKVKGREIKRPENFSIADKFLHNATGLTPTNLSTSPFKQIMDSTAETSHSDECIYSGLKPEEKRKIVGKDVISVLVCHVCREKLDSYEAFTEHCINNHPNVECSYVEILGDKDSPPVIPPELCKNNISPIGFRFAYDVLPIIHKTPVICTKCRKLFPTISELHEHIVICGNLVNLKPRLKFKIPVSSNHTMRKRMTMAQFRSGFNNRSGQTPEKRHGFVNKTVKSICDKTSKSEKLLFYKNGRLQTKSFTVDKNYFATKPKPVKTGMSKRGRKSYEEKSLVYRYAGMQPSTSRECPHCRVIFASIQILNNHIKICSQQSLKKNTAVAVSNSAAKNESGNDSTLNFTTNITENKSESQSENKSAVCNLSSSFNFPSSSSSAVSSEDLSFRSHESSHSILEKHSSVTDLGNVPIDLSRNSDSKSLNVSAEVSNQDNTRITKSALQIAMEAVEKHIIESPTDDPLLKLQHVTQKFTFDKKSSAKSPLVSPVLKSNSGKKVGRPRKLKKETSTPIAVVKPLTVSPVKKSPLKPKKLEEIVKGIKESRVGVDENGMQKKECSEQASLPENVSVKLSLSLAKIKQPDLLKPHKKTDDKIVDKNIVMINTDVQQSTSQKVNLSTADHNNSNYSVDLSSKCSTSFDNKKAPLKHNELTIIKLPEKSQVHDVSSNAVFSKFDVKASSPAGTELQNVPHENKITEITLTSPSSDLNISTKPCSATPDTNSHGRSSPTSEFECLLKSINQRLSEDKNQQDDSAIPWLEDEKFVIPSSRTPLTVIVTSNAEKTPIQTGNCIVPPNISIPKDKLNEKQGNSSKTEPIPPATTQAVQIKTIIINSKEPNKPTIASSVSQNMEPNFVNEKAKKETLNQPDFHNVLLPKDSKKEQVDKVAFTGEKLSSSEDSKPSNVLKATTNEVRPYHRKSLAQNLKTSIALSEKKILSKTSNSTPNSTEKRKPGRPRKKPIETPVESSNMAKLLPSIAKTKIASSKSDINNTETNASVKSQDVSLRNSISSANLSDMKKPSSSLEPAPLPMGTCSNQLPGNVSETDKTVSQTSNESETIEPSKNCLTKSKLVLDNDNNNIKAVFKPITTEFGKNLASKMKEKMRLSLEQDLPKTALSTEDANNSNCGSENSETNLQINTEEKIIIKKETETVESQKMKPCPYCKLEFAYLTNFRRHIRQCKARDQTVESEPVSGTQTSNMQYLPKKDEVDYCMLNLYRFQSRQTGMMKEDENVNKHIKTYECNICHKIYLNLFNLIQHKLSSHKLVEQQNPGCSSDISEMNILSLAGHLSPMSPRPGNESNAVDENIGLNHALNNILEDYQKPNSDDSQNHADGHIEVQCSKPENMSEKEVQSSKTAANKDLKSEDVKSVKQSDVADCHSAKLDNKSKISLETIIKENDKGDYSTKEVETTKFNNNSTGELPPVKRKRGRPLGWRKNSSISQETLAKSKKIRADNLKKSLFMLKKKGEISHSNPKLKSVTKRIIIDNMKKAIAKKKSKNLSFEEKSTVEPASVSDISDKKVDFSTPASNLLIPEEKIKNVPKQSSVKGIVESENATDSSKNPLEVTAVKTSPKVLEKSPVKSEVSVNAKNSIKRGRGRPPWKNVVRINKSIVKSEVLPKRRPGRPPKSSLSLSNQMQAVKFSIASSSSAKNPKRAPMPMLPVQVDSSDSDTNDTKNELPTKKKINLKCCALCSDKFVSSLELKRHIQLKHNRKKPDDTKSELQRKILKSHDSRSSSVDASDNEKDTSPKRCESPQRKSNQVTPGRKSDPGKANYRTAQVKKTEPNLKSAQSSSLLQKSPSSNAGESDKDISPKRSDIPQKNLKICAICKQKFPTGPLLYQHLQMFHNRKSEPITITPVQSATPGRKSQTASAKSSPSSASPTSPIRKKKELNIDRKSLSRQCRKPLPPLKRKRIMKKEPLEQIIKKSKL